MAKKLYEHILAHYPYSLTPHVTLQVLGVQEAQYVQEYRHGDCGAQSMLFSAMCRSLGIPARSTGGYQMIMGHAGTHFWAEFYLEGYGWIPVDVTVAEAGDWTGTISEDERRRFKAFFFANLDPYRYVIQKDVDLPLSPAPEETVLTDSVPPIVMQAPFIECPSCTANPFIILDSYTRTTITPVYR
ncbi:MAG: transglutaminase-like domain-containing protein [Pseudomonadota bacterium]